MTPLTPDDREPLLALEGGDAESLASEVIARRRRRRVWLTLTLALLLLPCVAHAIIVVTPPGVTCANDTRLTAPVIGQDYCFDATTSTLYRWSGAWERVAGVVFAKDYGAKCDGATDDSTALQTALNQTGRVFITPPCNHASTLTIPANTTVFGPSKDGACLTYTGAGVQLTVTGTNNAVYSEIRDLCLSATGGTAAIKTSKVREVAIRRVAFKGNTTGYSTACLWLSGDGTTQGGSQTVTWEDNRCESPAAGAVAILMDSQQSNGLLVKGGNATGVESCLKYGTTGATLGTTILGLVCQGAVGSTHPLVDVCCQSGFTVIGGYWESSSAQPIAKFSSGSGGVFGVSWQGGFFSGTGTNALEFQLGQGLSVAGVHVNGSFTNLVAATTPGAISQYTLLGTANTTNTFRDGAAGVQYPASSAVIASAFTVAGGATVGPSPTGGLGAAGTLNVQNGTIPGTSAFSNLGAPQNGTLMYCSDCTIASPCASGGTGALAKRLNSIWVCN